MLHEKYGPLAWTGEKRRRKYLPRSSSSDTPTATVQGLISHALFGPGEAAKDHHGPISDMAIVPEQDRALRSRKDSGEEETQELFGPLVILSQKDEDNYAKQLHPDVSLFDSITPRMSWPEKFKVRARLARHRITYCKIVKPESGCKLKDPYEYSEEELRNQEYFKYLEADESFEWFFHADDIWNPDFDDYQRIALRDIMPGREYINVYDYHDCYHTYEMDVVYVKYYGEISKKIKWIEEFLHLDKRSMEWEVMETRGWRQALRIARGLPHMTLRLASFAYKEYISELCTDAALKDLDLVYFEIWRLVVKDNRNYMDAVKLVHAMEKFHMHKCTMEAELAGTPVFCTMRQTIYGIILAEDIVAKTEDNKARDLFRKGVALLKKGNMAKYAEKKLEIAKKLNLHKRIEFPGQIEIP